MIIISKYTGGTAYKVGLHAHTNSAGDDGDLTPAAVAALCATAGMDAYAITGHDVLTDCASAFAGEGIVWLPGSELTNGTTTIHLGSHVTGCGVSSTFDSGHTYGQGNQANINAIVADGGFATLAHPNLDELYGMSLSTILSLTGYHAIEVAGPMCAAHFYGNNETYNDGSYGSINIVDSVLTQKGFISITCVSDFHRNNQDPGAKAVYVDEGFQVVYASARTASDITTALKAGNSYASNGPLLSSAPGVSGDVITIESDDSCTCEWVGDGGKGLRLDSANTTFSYTPESGSYVRAKLTRVSDGAIAWIQAMFFDLNLILTNIESVPTEVYNAYNGEVFSQDGVNYYQGVSGGDAVSVAAIGLTAYVG
jgi:hypothetical protein